jgi:hypothetical protein
VVQVEGYQHGSNFLIIITRYVEHQLVKFTNLVLCLHTVAETFNDGAKKENYSYNYFCKNEAVLSDIQLCKLPMTFLGGCREWYYNYLLTYDSYVPLYNRFHRGEWITRVSGGEGALDTPGPRVTRVRSPAEANLMHWIQGLFDPWIQDPE